MSKKWRWKSCAAKNIAAAAAAMLVTTAVTVPAFGEKGIIPMESRIVSGVSMASGSTSGDADSSHSPSNPEGDNTGGDENKPNIDKNDGTASDSNANKDNKDDDKASDSNADKDNKDDDKASDSNADKDNKDDDKASDSNADKDDKDDKEDDDDNNDNIDDDEDLDNDLDDNLDKIEFDDNEEESGLVITEQEIFDNILTEADKAKLKAGKTVTIQMEIEDVADDAYPTEKAEIKKRLGGYKEGVYLDIELTKQFTGETKENVTQTKGKVKVRYILPENLLNTNSSVNRTYKIIYYHGGEVKELKCSFDPETGSVTFEANQFSLYSLVYKDIRVGTSSGGGSDSDGGSSSSQSSLPSYVVTGNWNVLADGTWTFTDRTGKSYQNEWAALYNPYAAKGQEAYDWFRFDENKHMITGWFIDPADGNIYYLNPISNGRLGSMCTGWQWIDRDGDGVFECYFFNPASDGTRGRLICNTVTAEGYVLNENGQWVVDGVVQTR